MVTGIQQMRNGSNGYLSTSLVRCSSALATELFTWSMDQEDKRDVEKHDIALARR